MSRSSESPSEYTVKEARVRLRWKESRLGSRPGQHSWLRIAQNLPSLETEAFNKYIRSLNHLFGKIKGAIEKPPELLSRGVFGVLMSKGGAWLLVG